MKTHKHEKKCKHKQQPKKHKRKETSSSESGNDEYEWVEAPSSTPQEKSQREEWMSQDSFVPTISKDEMLASSRKRKSESSGLHPKYQEGHHDRELNRYWKENGTGVPDNLPEIETSSLQLPSSSVGDGGYNWLKKAYQRVQEQAEREGRTMEDVAVERWGSLEKLKSLLNEAGNRRKELHHERREHHFDSQNKMHHKEHHTNLKKLKNTHDSERHRCEKHKTSYNKDLHEEKHSSFKSETEYVNSQTGSHSSNGVKLCREPHEKNLESRKDSSSEYSLFKFETERVKSGSHLSSVKRGFRKPQEDNWESGKGSSLEMEHVKSGSHSSSTKRGFRKTQEDYRESGKGSFDDLPAELETEHAKSGSHSSSVKKGFRKPQEDNWEPRKDSAFKDLSPKLEMERVKSGSHSSSVKTGFRKPQEDNREPRKDSSFNDLPAKLESECVKSGSHSTSVQKAFRKPHDYDRESRKESYSAIKSSNQPSWKKSNFVGNRTVLLKRDSKSSSTSPPKDLPPKEISPKEQALAVPEEHHAEPQHTEQVVLILDEDELNILASQMIKAELLGDTELLLKLKNQLDASREASKNVKKSSLSRPIRKDKEVLLTKTDSYGMSRPLYAPENKDSRHPQAHKKEKMGKFKQSKFLDDSKYSLKQMFEKEKLTTADDHLEMFLDVAAACKESSNNDYDDDDVSGKISKRMGHYPQDEKDISKAIREDKRRSAVLSRCQFCFGQSNMKMHLIIKMAKETFLCVPPYKSLVDGHCLIVPKSHVISSLLLEDNEWEEIQDFKKGLIKMFGAQDKCVIFTELSINQRQYPHSVIECIPMPKETGELAPLYFKKAIEESESEWAQNKKLIDLFKKNVRHSVPKGLPFFCVEFGVKGGYAHVIEDELRFPKNFARETIGGMLDIESHHTMKNRKEDYNEQISKVLKFEKEWQLYEETALSHQ